MLKRFFVGILAFVLVGCGFLKSSLQESVMTPTSVPLQATLSTYIHYKPLTGSKVHLEFDYPSAWTYSQDGQDPNFIVLGFGDPRFRSLPTTSYTPNDFGSIDIWIMPAKLDQTSFTELESTKQGYLEEPRYHVLTDYKITIDGYDAGVLEYTIEPTVEDYPSVMFNKRIILVLKDQWYEILFQVAEKDREGKFEKEFEYFFNSIKIVL